MAGKIRHLQERNGRFYARVVVPKPLHGIIGKSALTEALDADERIAIRMLPAVVARMHNLIDAARVQNGTAPKGRTQPVRGRPMTTRQMANAHYESELAIDEMGRNIGHQNRAHYAEPYRDKLKLVAAGLESDPDAIGAAIGWALDAFQKRGNVQLERDSIEWRSLARTLAGVQMEALERVKERDEGDYSGTPKLPVLTERTIPC